MTLSGFVLALGLLGVAPLALILTGLRVVLRRPKIEVHWSAQDFGPRRVLTVHISNEPTAALVKTLGIDRRSIDEMFCGATIWRGKQMIADLGYPSLHDRFGNHHDVVGMPPSVYAFFFGIAAIDANGFASSIPDASGLTHPLSPGNYVARVWLHADEEYVRVHRREFVVGVDSSRTHWVGAPNRDRPEWLRWLSRFDPPHPTP